MSTQKTDDSQDDTRDDSLITTDVQTGANARAERADETVIETRDLDVHYGDDQALRDVSIEIPENKVTALIGPRAAGSRRSSGVSTG